MGLICIGLLGLGTVFFIQLQNRQEQDAIVVQPPTLPPPTFTPTPTETPFPTDTPLPTPTSTLVVIPGQEEPEAPPPPAEPGAEVTPTNTLVVPPTPAGVVGTPVPGATTAPAQIPDGGGVLPRVGSGYLVLAGIALLALLTIGAVNHMKPPRPPAGP